MAKQVKFKQQNVSIGDKIRVLQKIQEGDKIRTQPFEGILIAIKGEGENKMITVRKIAAGNIGVERIWPLNSSWIEDIKVLKQGQVRRAKLYYLREKPGKLKFIHEKEKPRPARRKSRPKTSKK